MIVIDTSVFIDLLNDITTQQVGRLEFLAEEEFIVLGDLIAVYGAGKATLRTEAQPLQRHILCGFVDSLNQVLF